MLGRRGNQKRLLDLVVTSVRVLQMEDFFIANTKYTPKNGDYCALMTYKTTETRGEGYVGDLQELLLSYLEFVSIACDIPFLRSEHEAVYI